MFAAHNKSAQALALVALLLEGKADVNAVDDVSAWEGDGVRGHVYGVCGLLCVGQCVS